MKIEEEIVERGEQVRLRLLAFEKMKLRDTELKDRLD